MNLTIRALRRELAELQDPGPGPTQQLYQIQRDGIIADLRELGAEPEDPPHPHMPIPRIVQPTKGTRCFHPAPQELPMPTLTISRQMPEPMTPRIQVENLLERVRANPNAKSAGLYRRNIRSICRVHGLETPVEAMRQRGPVAPKAAPKSKPEAMAAVLGSLSPLAKTRASIEHLRALTWSLLASLEVLTPDDRRALVPDLELFDAAAATTVQVGKRVAA